ncbi:hypothetical protein [Billgrantia kenyensis]|uniref:Lipocalin-like domain-containing protein n=1 Tax=Billgrantia kenyensis TaxID=321266 RepID=A0A7V9W568_9GAMM|nr:hypothetical protein [Halomonas kenyensis]MBA2781205.1 hypothetical protein [Halomonas kenyensis]MCG6663887.1 hypothetical protein [Halomonas kenyensis]
MRTLMFFLLFSPFFAFAEGEKWFLGNWRITEVNFPGFSALTEQEADEWLDRIIQYNMNSVELSDKACQNPLYMAEFVDSNDYMVGHRFSLETLGIHAGTVEIVSVDCDQSWLGPGLTIIKKNGDAAYIPWDGAYFFISRER